jgi:hypothetical protein
VRLVSPAPDNLAGKLDPNLSFLRHHSTFPKSSPFLSVTCPIQLQSAPFPRAIAEIGITMPHTPKPLSPKQLAPTDGDIEIARSQNRNYCLADGFLRLVRQSNGWSIFLRYQAQAERQYRRALEDFDRFESLHHVLPNEPIFTVQPKQESATYPNPDTNPSDAQTHQMNQTNPMWGTLSTCGRFAGAPWARPGERSSPACTGPQPNPSHPNQTPPHPSTLRKPHECTTMATFAICYPRL